MLASMLGVYRELRPFLPFRFPASGPEPCGGNKSSAWRLFSQVFQRFSQGIVAIKTY